jgi:hypothetical protein
MHEMLDIVGLRHHRTHATAANTNYLRKGPYSRWQAVYIAEFAFDSK